MTGSVLLIARLFDTFTDTLVGILCDRLSTLRLKRKSWIAVGAVVAGPDLFKILNLAEGVSGSYLLVWSLVLYAGWKMVVVPYLVWGAELSSDYHELTRITFWRKGFGLLGIICGAWQGAATVSLSWSEKESIGAIAWAAIALGVIFFPLMLHTVPERSAIRVIVHKAATAFVRRPANSN